VTQTAVNLLKVYAWVLCWCVGVSMSMCVACLVQVEVVHS